MPLRLEKASGQSPLHDVKDGKLEYRARKLGSFGKRAHIARSAMAHRSAGRGTAPKGARARIQQMGSGVGGARRDRTDDLLLAKQALSQLSYGPFGSKAERSQRSEARRRSALLGSDFWLPVSEILTMVGLGRLELPTSRLSGVRSNRLSYRPDAFAFASCLEERETETAEIPLCFRIRSDSLTGPLSSSSRYGEREGSSMKAHP